MTSSPDHVFLRITAESVDAPSDPTGEAELLLAHGFRRQALAVAQKIADRRGTTMAEELIRLDYLPANTWWELMARDLGVRYFADLSLAAKPRDALLPDARLFQRVRQVWHRKSESAILVVAPLGHEIDRLRRDIAHDSSMRHRIAIAAPQTIRHAFRRSFEPALTYQAINRLRSEHPAMSAADGQASTRWIIGYFLAALVLSFVVPGAMLALLDLLFLIAGGLRLASAIDTPAIRDAPALPDAALPTYAVLVPLFREARVVRDLVRAIERIDYPRDRLSVMLIVEADDRETMMAALRMTAGSPIRVIAVPPSKPRTKPKALAWALPFVGAELLTVYDAEDRPAPDQLRRAAAAFAAAPPDVVCVQAMLDIDHTAASSNWLSRQFALEYRVLFRALLPWLAGKQLFLPLGGTSNHFRRDALVRAGGWDPFNVTEDADVAVRLVRMGGRIGVIDSVTSEEAPVRWRAWHLQRTRWIKGWLQTWIVHMQHPRRLLRDVGLKNFATIQVLILGQVLSALVCPFGIILVALDLAGLVPLFADRDFTGDLLLAFQLLALCFGWLGSAAAVLATSGRGGRMVRRSDLLTVPVYWLLLFAAALNAITELIVDPHRWNKTGHGIAERSGEPKSARFPPRVPNGATQAGQRPLMPGPQRNGLLPGAPPPPRLRLDRPPEAGPTWEGPLAIEQPPPRSG